MNPKKYRFTLIPLALFVIASYGLLIHKLGIYWDDWAYIWTRIQLGFHGLLRHFSFSRPVAGQIHNIAILATNGDPLKVQLWSLLFQVLGSFCLGALVRQTWKDDFTAALAALFFIAYPGFSMQPIGINFAFSYFLIGILCISFILGIRAKGRLSLILPACLLALINLFASEYFFLLELLRPFFFYVSEEKTEDRWKRALRKELPYASVFFTGLLYRLFFNKTQTAHYSFRLLDDLKSEPLKAIGTYLSTMLRDCYRVCAEAWGLVFGFPDMETFGKRSTFIYMGICLIVFAVTLISLLWIRRGNGRIGAELISLGVLALILGGQPYWVTESSINFVFPNCRYTLSLMPGISMIFAGILAALPRPKWIASLIAAVFIGLAAGNHFVNTNAYRRDWTITKDFFSQLSWRIPAIRENTVVVTNVLPIRFSTDNSLTAPLNWIYADAYETDIMPYMLYTNTKRENTLSGFESGQPIMQEYLSAQFHGNTDDMISVYYNAPGCAHVLDPEIDIFNQMIPELDRNAALLNNYSRILPDAEPHTLPEKLFGSEAARNWCYYYESADLARQGKDWERVATLGDEGFAGSDHPNDPMERIPFIEGYAHCSRWDDALAQTAAAYEVTPVMNDPLCAIWDRIDRETEESGGKAEALSGIADMLDCSFLEF